MYHYLIDPLHMVRDYAQESCEYAGLTSHAQLARVFFSKPPIRP